MATTQQYSLRWNNYLRHLTYSLDNHRLNDDFVDVTLCVDGRKIKAHKVVLSSCSSYFKEIFKENPHPHPVIIFKFIKFEDLNSIIEFMYQGEVNVQQEALQSFLQTAELLAVQGLTAEEKEKPQLPALPLSDHKIIKTIPSTIRAVNDQQQQQQQQQQVPSVAQAQTATQTIEIPTATLLQATAASQVQTQVAAAAQLQVQQQQQQAQSQSQQQHHHVQTNQIQHIQVQSAPPPPQQQQQQQTQQQLTQPVATTPQHLTITNAVALAAAKKRKLTFSDDDDNIYTTETVAYSGKDDQTIVKTSDMTFLRSAVKMDIPDYIVSEVDDRLSDGATPQTSQDATTGAAQTVAQYSSEYEILTESEIEEKYQADAENAEIAIEMTRLLGSGTGATSTPHAVLEDGSPSAVPSTTVSLTPVKADGKGGNVAPNAPSGTGGGPGLRLGTDTDTDPLAEDETAPEMPLICHFCKRRLKSTNALRRHIASRHSEIQDKQHECYICMKSFKTKWSLSTHNSRFHRDLRQSKEFIKIETADH
ncbi:broad-complex core protein isoforms 1/2/3/4/5 isoform X1 [Drosophila persimilis]|uniref:broad-complex core protein isoforms 1/2/3/4/5 isoform X1 n=1 Tax=Drosophila persimilis TaxID=7234 RepID=UPI000F076E81|nr:broad-complex core protein isoforms 1/2/3/4/5 isoform X1 [Drosophila persimilis]